MAQYGGLRRAAFADGHQSFAGRHRKDIAEAFKTVWVPMVVVTGTGIVRPRSQAQIQPVGFALMHDVLRRACRAEVHQLRRGNRRLYFRIDRNRQLRRGSH